MLLKILRKHIIDVIFLISTLCVLWFLVQNVIGNIGALNTPHGFAFLEHQANFGIVQSLIDYSSSDTYGRALLVGIINTFALVVPAIILATLVGILVGVAQLSQNWALSNAAMIYNELVRNVPLLLHIFMWYFVLIGALPLPRESIEVQVLSIVAVPLSWFVQYAPLPDLLLPISLSESLLYYSEHFLFFVNNRGIAIPALKLENFSWLSIFTSLAIAILLSQLCVLASKLLQRRTGMQIATWHIRILLIIGIPIVWLVLNSNNISLELPVKGKFNITGGAKIIPEFLALLGALVLYTGASIAVIVRGGIQSVAAGQAEAATALGLSSNKTLRLILIPQAMPTIIPSLTSQYLNLTKNSSLAVAIGYPDIVSTGGTILNQTGQAIEMIIIWMVFYLSLSLFASLFMNWFNSKSVTTRR